MQERDPEPPVIVTLYPAPDEKEAVEFFSALGQCVSSWAFIDRRLYEIYCCTTKLDQVNLALRYYRLRAFGPRLKLVDAALRSSLELETIVKYWQPLHARTLALSYTRNILAHHPAKRLGKSMNGQPRYIYTIYIEPYERILNQDYPGLRGKQELSVQDLRQHDREVEVLEQDLRWFLRVHLPTA